MVIFFGLIWYFGALGIDNFFLAEFYGGVFMCLFPKKIVRFMGLLEIGLVVGFVCLFFFFWGGGVTKLGKNMKRMLVCSSKKIVKIN